MSEDKSLKQAPAVPITPKSGDPPQGYAAGMQKDEGQTRGHLGEIFLTIDPKNIDAQSRLPSVIAMATHETVRAWASGEKEYTTREGVKFQIDTLAGIMGTWEFAYGKKSIGLDGKARQEAENVMKLEAIGPQDDSILAQSVLNEGAKNLSSKKEGKK